MCIGIYYNGNEYDFTNVFSITSRVRSVCLFPIIVDYINHLNSLWLYSIK